MPKTPKEKNLSNNQSNDVWILDFLKSENSVKGRITGCGGWTTDQTNNFLDFIFTKENDLNLKRNIKTVDIRDFSKRKSV